MSTYAMDSRSSRRLCSTVVVSAGVPQRACEAPAFPVRDVLQENSSETSAKENFPPTNLVIFELSDEKDGIEMIQPVAANEVDVSVSVSEPTPTLDNSAAAELRRSIRNRRLPNKYSRRDLEWLKMS